jgi:hypothetical protein
VTRLNTEIAGYLRDPAVVQRFAGFGGVAAPDTPEQFRALMIEDRDRFRALIARTGITPG